MSATLSQAAAAITRTAALDLALLMLEARKEDEALPIRQRDRHALVSRAREKIRLIEAKLKEIEA